MDLSNYLQTARQVISNPDLTGNAVLTYTTTTGVDISYDDLGNPVIEDTTESVTLTAWLKQSKPPDNEVQEGLNQNREYFAGELINPKTFELPFRPDDSIAIVINNRNGKFYPVDIFDSPASMQWNINQYLGQKIAGWVEFEEGN